jgi:hypothetical protein
MFTKQVNRTVTDVFEFTVNCRESSEQMFDIYPLEMSMFVKPDTFELTLPFGKTVCEARFVYFDKKVYFAQATAEKDDKNPNPWKDALIEHHLSLCSSELFTEMVKQFKIASLGSKVSTSSRGHCVPSFALAKGKPRLEVISLADGFLKGCHFLQVRNKMP